MTREELAAKCREARILICEGEHEGKRGTFLHWPNPNDPADEEACFIEEGQLGRMDWPAVERAVINGRDVTGYTRIVGYVSAVKNWNKSKIGELADRHRGDYSLAHTA